MLLVSWHLDLDKFFYFILFINYFFVVNIQGKKKDEDMDSQHFATLERLRQTQRQDYLRGAVSGSVQATDRLMKELRDIYRSDSSKKGNFLR